MLKFFFVSFIILGTILTPYSFNFPSIQFTQAATYIHYNTINEDTTWDLAGSPYIITSEGINIIASSTLTIEPGVIIKLIEGSMRVGNGKIIANGMADQPIIFTSINDDARGGKSAGLSNGEPNPGDWRAIYAEEESSLEFNYVVVNYGGGEPVYLERNNQIIISSTAFAAAQALEFSTGAITAAGGAISINNSKLTDNIIGLQVAEDYYNAKPIVAIHNSEIRDNQLAGIVNYSSNQIDARDNWWGDDAGPSRLLNFTHPSNEPGYDIYGDVLFDPWIGKQEKKDPVIIVPGIMGSWYSDEDGWQLDPILNTYDNLWEALKSAGYEENKTLFAFPYQWRNSNVISAGYLKNKINEVKSICECEKVDIVAHSMGGLVARYYVESDDYENDIDQLVFLGVPHKGAPKAYLQWEAAEGFISYKEKIAEFYFSIEAHLLGYDSLFEYIQNRVKSVEQLLPIYLYLQDTGSVKLREYNQISYPNNYPYNSFLESLNSEENLNRFSNSGVKVFNIAGNSGDNTIGVISVSSGEQYYPMWEHGYMEEVIYISGDNTVPHMSSSLFPTTAINDTKHNQIPTNAQKQIIEYLTGQMPVIEINDTPEPEEILAVAIYSPADFAIISPSGKRLGKDFLSDTNINEIDYAFYTGFENEPEFAVIINPEQGDYKVELRGTGSGEYKLDLSYIDEEKEITKEFTGNIQTGEGHSFNFTYNDEGEESISDLIPEDNTPPIIAINNPTKNEQYLHSEELAIDYTAKDDFSGVAEIAIKLDNQILSTTTIDLFYYDLGEHVLNITAVDNAGNSASAEVKFEIITNIDSAIQDIERIYDLGWISKKYVKQILITELEVLRKRLDIFTKQKEIIEKLKQKILNNSTIKEKHKQKLLDEFNKRLQELEQQEDEFIEKSLSLLAKTLDKFLRKAVISQQGYGIIISDINYLRENLK